MLNNDILYTEKILLSIHLDFLKYQWKIIEKLKCVKEKKEINMKKPWNTNWSTGRLRFQDTTFMLPMIMSLGQWRIVVRSYSD